MHASPKLHVERVEDRTVPAVFGNTWIDPNLTVSFAPDGTDVGGIRSSLSATLGQRATAAEWQAAVRTAFAKWTGVTNLAVTFVADDGRAVGSPGPVQGSPHVGDIRLTARTLSDDVLAVANPFDLASGWAGEIVLNSTKAFDTDGSAGAYDLTSVMLHEIGHSLGLGESGDPLSVMSDYTGVRRQLAAADVSAIQSLYGKPGQLVSALFSTADQTIQSAGGVVSASTDWTLGLGTNDTRATASRLGVSRDATDRRWDFSGIVHLANAKDVDVYQVRAGESVGGGVMVVYVGTATGGVTPKVAVADSEGRAVRAQVLMQDGEATILQIEGVVKSQTYTVFVASSTPNVRTARERYHLGVDFRDTAVTLTSVAAGTFTAEQPVFAKTLTVESSQGFRFQLLANGRAALVVYDADRQAVFTLAAEAGQTVFEQVMLPPGEYTVAVRGAAGVRFDARSLATTDPIGMDKPSDPTTTPDENRTAAPPPPSDSTYTWSGYNQAYYSWLW